MIINKPGAKFRFEGTEYIIGATIIGTNQSEYAGLFGNITEIRDGEDKETENDTPDFYCSFDVPNLPHKIREIEDEFSDLYGTPKTLEDICLDCVIMAPEMVRPISEKTELLPDCKVYIVMEDWAANDDQGSSVSVAYTDKEKALYQMSHILQNEKENGCIADWKSNTNFIEDSTEDTYEGYIDGYYCSCHYCISIMEICVDASLSFVEKVANMYRNK